MKDDFRSRLATLFGLVDPTDEDLYEAAASLKMKQGAEPAVEHPDKPLSYTEQIAILDAARNAGKEPGE